MAAMNSIDILHVFVEDRMPVMSPYNRFKMYSNNKRSYQGTMAPRNPVDDVQNIRHRFKGP